MELCGTSKSHCFLPEIEEGAWSLEDLPQDAMNTVLSFLTFLDYQELSVVSKRVNVVLSHASHLYMMDSFSPRYTRLSLLADIGKRPLEMHLNEERLRRLLQRYPSLNVLHLYGLAAVGDNLFAILNESPASSTITQLSLHGCSLSYWCTNSLALANLRHIRISGGSIRAAFGSLLSACCSIQSLSIGQCSSLRDENVADLVHNLGEKLENLSLHQCLRVKNPVLQFDNLLSLNLMGCFALCNLPRFHCPTLRRLDLSFCFRLDGTRVQNVIATLPVLREMILVKCAGIESLIVETAPELKSINVSLCTNLRHLELRCPQLVHVEVSRRVMGPRTLQVSSTHHGPERIVLQADNGRHEGGLSPVSELNNASHSDFGVGSP